jgi:hypothetical protein
MKRSWFLAALFLAGTVLAAPALDQKYLSVTVQKTQVRATAGYLGSVLGILYYGDRVAVLAPPSGAPADWVYVLGPDGKLTGWVNRTALTEKRIVLSSGGAAAAQTASSGDVALAGKGFNSDVEAEYKSDEKLDYTWVDRMQTFVIPPESLAAFVRQGGLNEAGVAQ